MESWQREIFERLGRNVIDNGNECTGWTGGRFGNGRPAIWFRGRNELAYRVLWEAVFGPIPKGLCVRHTCDNKECLNISHLLLGTHRDNMKDTQGKGTMGRANLKVTKEMKAEMLTLAAEGIPYIQIGKRLGVSRTTVRNHILGKHGVLDGR